MKLSHILLLIFSGNHLLMDAMHGGDTDYIEKVPYMAQLFKLYDNGLESFCGAAILARDWIVTAAHCTAPDDNLQSLQMRVGTNTTLIGGDIYDIDKVYSYRDYSPNTTRWNDDISLIKLKRLVRFNKDRQPITISRVPPRVGDEIIITGYGDDYGDVYGKNLKVGHQRVISKAECRRAYRKTDRRNIEIGDRVFCTDSTTLDLCGGDSGSPAVIEHLIVGMAVEGCESPLPNIYINMAFYYNWIYETMGKPFLI